MIRLLAGFTCLAGAETGTSPKSLIRMLKEARSGAQSHLIETQVSEALD
jgi:hypothetical protein